MGAKKNISITICDYISVVRAGLSSYFESKGYKIKGLCDCGGALLHSLKSQVPDVIILEPMNLYYDDKELMMRIRKKHPEIKILILTALDQNYVMAKNVELGVHGHLTKYVGLPEIERAVKSVIKGEFYSDNVQAFNYKGLIDSCDEKRANELLRKFEVELISTKYY